MNIKSAEFIKGIVGPDQLLENKKPKIAFIGRSNVGKSSVINSLVKIKNLARTSSFPGRTQEINIFFINKSFYLVDLPGYGFTKTKIETKETIFELINWYFFVSEYKQKKVILIIDVKIGLTPDDLEMLAALDEHKKDVVILANKIDKLNKTELIKHLEKIQAAVGTHKVIPFSAKKGIGISSLVQEIL